jgi:sugar O-acyltransferase (sialic acid O-acetyltransferase NeuD family)
MNLPVIILGGGDQAKVLIDTLLLQGRKVIGFIEPHGERKKILGISRLGNDNTILEYDPKKIRLVNGVGSIASTLSRKMVYERFRVKGYVFESVVHPSAVIGSEVRLEEGVQIMAGAVVQAGSSLGANTILNTGALVDHDCEVGAHVHIATGAVLSGTVRIEDEVHIGTGAVIIQGLVVGSKSVIGAGAVVLKDVPPGVTLVGVPGKIIGHQAAK